MSNSILSTSATFRQREQRVQVQQGTGSDLARLLQRMHESSLEDKPLWRSSARIQKLPYDQQYFDLAETNFDLTNLPPALAGLEKPHFIKPVQWTREVAPALINAILKYNTDHPYDSTEIGAMMAIVVGDLRPRIGFEENFAGVFGEQVYSDLDSEVIRCVQEDDAKFLFFGGTRIIHNSYLDVWYLMLVDVESGILYFIDPLTSSQDLKLHQKSVFYHMRRLWEKNISVKGKRIPAPKIAINLPLAQQTEGVSSPIATILNAFLLLREPKKVLDYVGMEHTVFKLRRTFSDGLIHLFGCCLARKVHPIWEATLIGLPERPSYLEPLPPVAGEDDVRLQALKVRIGMMEHVTQLLESMYGKLPMLSDNFYIPFQPVSARIIDAHEAFYEPHTSRANRIMMGRRPLDGSGFLAWRGDIGPRLANALLLYERKKPLSAPEIGALLHMLLVEFYPGSQRRPTVMIERVFGSFLRRGAGRCMFWESDVLKYKPKFLILGRRQTSSFRHKYIIIVEVATGRVYCFDSMTIQDNRDEHMDVFERLRKRWSISFPQSPQVQQMLELPSYTSMENYSSGYLCAYHIYLLFRTPVKLWELQNGDVEATKRDVDTIMKAVRGYIGIKVGANPDSLPEHHPYTGDPFVNSDPEESVFGKGALLKRVAHKPNGASSKRPERSLTFAPPQVSFVFYHTYLIL
jgi:hypothetical protein